MALYYRKPTFLIMLGLMWFIVGNGIFFANADRFLTATQVVDFHGGNGIAFSRHIAMWLLDPFLISPLVALIYANYQVQWTTRQLVTCLVLGFSASVYLHFGPYAADAMKKPTAAFHDGMLTLYGQTHLAYMGFAITAFLLFYFASSVTANYAAGISLALAAHTAVSTIQPAWKYGSAEAFNPTAVTIVLSSWLLLFVGFRQLRRNQP
jgi:hypothetical protein